MSWTHDVQANLLNDYLLPHVKGEKKRALKRKIKPLQKQDGDHVQVCPYRCRVTIQMLLHPQRNFRA